MAGRPGTAGEEREGWQPGWVYECNEREHAKSLRDMEQRGGRGVQGAARQPCKL